MVLKIRQIEPKDDGVIEQIIRSCLIEYGANHEGTAWADPNLGSFSTIYHQKGQQYWVAEKDGQVVGGVGIGKLEGEHEICELQKMYCIKEIRGSGVAFSLLQTALEYASKYYRQCYLETCENMIEAQKFYEKHGFKRIKTSLGKTSHYACEVRYLIDLGGEDCAK